MKTAFTLFAGFLALSRADDSEEALSFSSDSTDDTSPSLGGLSVGVFLNAGDADVPQVVLSQEDDGSNYCLNIERIFEATSFELTNEDGTTCSQDCEYDEVTGSSISLGDAGCGVDQVTPTIFVIDCDDDDFNLTLNFTYVAGDDGSNGLEFTIDFAGYTFVSDDENAVLVLEQSLEDCSDTRDIAAESTDDDSDDDDSDEESDDDDSTTSGASDDDDDDDMSTESPENTVGPARRRLLDSHEDDDDHSHDHDDDNHSHDDDSDDDDSDEEEDDDANEVGVGLGAFRLTVTTGQDVCEDTTTDVALQLVYQSGTDKIQIVAERFDCTLNIDPWVGVNAVPDSKASRRFITSVFAFALVFAAVIFV